MTFAFEKISDSIPRRASSCAWASSFLAEWSLDNLDRKSTRLNSSHSQISYAVFCLKKKNSHLAAASQCHRLSLATCSAAARRTSTDRQRTQYRPATFCLGSRSEMARIAARVTMHQ